MSSRTHPLDLAPAVSAHSSAVPAWAVPTAWTAVLASLPTVLWRALVGLGVPLGTPAVWRAGEQLPGTGTAYVLGLSVVECLAALLTLRLVRPNGDVVPRWSPIGPGRRLPTAAVSLTALGGVVALVLICVLSVRSWSVVDPFAGQIASGWSRLCAGCYLAALLWPPAVVATVIGYVKGRRNQLSVAVGNTAQEPTWQRTHA